MWVARDRVDAPLYVVTSLFNPVRFKSRLALYRDFAKRVVDAGAKLITVEAAFGERDHAVTDHAPDDDGHTYVRLRVGDNSELWLKENLLNIGTSRLPPTWKYVAFADADISWSRPDWVDETRHALQHFDVVQMYSHIISGGPNHEPLTLTPSFGYAHVHDVRAPAQSEYGSKVPPTPAGKRVFGTPGGAWGWRRSAFEAVGGLIDFAILGAADHYMALGLVGDAAAGLDHRFSPGYREAVLNWQTLAEKKIQRNIGYIDGAIWHHWHGSYVGRQYGARSKILIRNAFDPRTDLTRNWQGVIALTGNKPRLRDDVRSYFRQRNEDSVEATARDGALVAPKPLANWD